MNTILKKLAISAATTGLLSSGLFAVAASQANEAEAAVCGYSTQMEDYESGWSMDIPLAGTVDPFGGQRQVAYYGNCTNSNVQIRVTTANGTTTECVAPGETRLGWTEHGDEVSNAVRTGTC